MNKVKKNAVYKSLKMAKNCPPLAYFAWKIYMQIAKNCFVINV